MPCHLRAAVTSYAVPLRSPRVVGSLRRNLAFTVLNTVLEFMLSYSPLAFQSGPVFRGELNKIHTNKESLWSREKCGLLHREGKTQVWVSTLPFWKHPLWISTSSLCLTPCALLNQTGNAQDGLATDLCPFRSCQLCLIVGFFFKEAFVTSSTRK